MAQRSSPKKKGFSVFRWLVSNPLGSVLRVVAGVATLAGVPGAALATLPSQYADARKTAQLREAHGALLRRFAVRSVLAARGTPVPGAFKPVAPEPRQKEGIASKVARYAQTHPSLGMEAVGVVPLIGDIVGAAAIPQHVREIEAAERRQNLLAHSVMVMAARGTAVPTREPIIGASLATTARVAPARESREVAARIAVMRAALRAPAFSRLARQASLQRGRAVGLSSTQANRLNQIHGIEPRWDYKLASRRGFRLGQPVEASRAAAERGRAMRSRGKA